MTPSKKTQDRRALPRASVYHLAKYLKPSDPSKGKPILTSVQDISGSGICLYTEEPLKPSTVMQIYINFPGMDKTIPCLIQVIWIRQISRKPTRYKIGCKFIEIEDVFRQMVMKRVSLATAPKEEKIC